MVVLELLALGAAGFGTAYALDSNFRNVVNSDVSAMVAPSTTATGNTIR